MTRRFFVIALCALLVPPALLGCRRQRSRTVPTESGSAPAGRGVDPASVVATSPDAETLAVAPPLPSAPAPDWKVYRGEGFELRYPPEATVGPDTSFPTGLPGIGIRGPRIALRSSNPDIGTHTGPAYALVISTFANPANRPLEAWVDSVRAVRNAHPMDPDSLDFLAPPDTATIAGHRVLTLSPFCGDCQSEEAYVAGPGRVLVASKLYDLSIPGDERAQWRLYDAILSTLRWTE